MKNIQHTAKTLVQLSRWRAENQPDKLAYIYLEDGEREAGSFTYREIDLRAKSIAAKLQSLNLKDERALLIYESGLDYIDSFFGCLYSGVISVPLHLPGKNKSLSRISSIARDSDAKIILSTKEIRTGLEKEFAKDDVLKNLKWVDTESLSKELAEDWEDTGIDENTLAYLQYTSGSTGVPKGVMVNHKNLITNINIIDKSHKHNDDSVMVTWLPIHHDMGLIYGILLPFCCGYPCYFMTPQAFVQKPYRWLKAITDYKGTHNAAPNFAFELCVNKITKEQKKNLNLSSWTVAMNAAEPVRAETIIKFVDYFKECGFELKFFCPGYGLAEGTLILSTTFKDDLPAMKRFDDGSMEKNNFAKEADDEDSESKTHVGHSHSIEDTGIAIVNPVTFIECKEGEVGEVWGSGISIAQGYWKREDATKETFKAFIADTNEGPFMRTGDLGFIKDNELYITGRHKDLIIIRGQNHYPQDIEYTVESSHPALRLGCVAAFSVEEDGEEHLGIVQEVQKNFVNDFEADEVIKAIRKAVSEEHDLQVQSITLIRPGSVPKTSSGKIQRRACSLGITDGTLEVVVEWKHGEISDYRSPVLNLIENKADQTGDISEKSIFTPATKNLKGWLVNRLSEMMQIKKESIDTNEPFAAYGMDSLKAVQLSGDLEILLDKELPATLVYDYPTIDQLSSYLSVDQNENTVSLEDIKAEKLKTNNKQDDIKNEPIAIVGIGLRFPGAVSVDEFWNNLNNGRDSIREIPEERWNKNHLKKSTVTFGGFADDVDKFDPAFFGISPREAVQIDPQQRFALEVAWEALEDAGINPETLTGTNAGVFMGICTYDYARFSSGKKELFDVYTGTGTSLSIAANRISYVYDFRGPSIAVDTACSSSLVALHMACESLRNNESSTALAGGVNLLLAPDWNVVFTEADMLAPDGKCKTFDASADGYVRSEGCGIVVLKKLSDAVKDGDRIYSVIKGSAINQDGRSNGLTAPNGPSQEEVIKSALKNADVKASQINYFETHGTGTPLGDPIEVNSLTRVITKDRSPENICYIGSVKTNIGHLEAAAGIAGIIKTSLALYNKKIPAHLNYKDLNPEILIKDTPVKIAVKNIKWDNNNRLASVSSFGFGGTNAHVILGEAPESVQQSSLKTKPFNLFTISAKNENVLNELLKKYERFLETNDNIKLEDVCFTANYGRASHSNRIAIVCSSTDDLKKKLNSFNNKKITSGIISGVTKINHHPKVAFLFPGQGAQFIGMGKELYDTHPLFRNIINKCDEILRNYLDKLLLEVLFYEKDEKLNPINETTYTQPALFAIEYALSKLWMSWGIIPSVMMGHSAGEYVAACLAGVFSLEDGLKMVTERGRLMQSMTPDGEMYTIFTDERNVKSFINGFGDSVSVASINGPLKTVISGKKESMKEILPRFDEKQIEYKKINVSIASHSPLMNSMIEEFRKVCETVKYSVPEIPVVSNITGEIVSDKISNANYWCDHILSTVRFSEGIKACVKYGCELFIDLGPKPTSISMGQETIQNADIHWLPSIKYNFTIWETMLQSLGTLYVKGTDVDWNNFDKDFSHKKISLPAYPFQKQRYWIEDIIEKKADLNFNFGYSANSLHGRRSITASDKEFIFNSQISGNDPVFLKDHLVFDEIVLPGAAYIEIVLSAFFELTEAQNISVSDIAFIGALILKIDEPKNVQTILRTIEKNKFSFEIFSLDHKEDNDHNVTWTSHASGNIEKIEKISATSIDLNILKKDHNIEINVQDFYNEVKGIGIEYKKDFQGIREIFLKENSALAKIENSKELISEDYKIHPALLDACFQAAITMLLKDKKDRAFIPAGISEFLYMGKSENNVWSLIELNPSNIKSKFYGVNIKIFSGSGSLLALIKDLKLKEVSREEFSTGKEKLKDWFYEVKWEPAELNGKGLLGDTGIIKVKEGIESNFNKLSAENNLTEYKQGIDELESASLSFIIKSFQNLGLKFEKGKKFSKEELQKEMKISKKYFKLFGRLLEILEKNEIIEIKGKIFEIQKDIDANAAYSEQSNIKIKTNSSVEAEYNLLSVCGSKLSEVLTGKEDPLQLLFPDGDFAAATALYQNSPGFIAMNESVKTAVEGFINSVPENKIIRILEIGAGTGSTASYILPVLSMVNSEYTFTDISAAFFKKAKEKFKEYPLIDYKVLDIEKDITEQGFKKNNYDLIIASNVIHATKDLQVTIKNILELLSAGGSLILNEVTQKQSWIDLTFGLTDGWWRFEDNKLRASYPLLSNSEWKLLLTNSGFKNVESFSFQSNEESLTGQSLMIGATDNKKDTADTKNKRVLVVFADRKTISEIERSPNHQKMNIISVTDNEKYEEVKQNKYTINYSRKIDYEKLFKDISSNGNDRIEIIYINPRKNSLNIADMEILSGEGCLNVLNIIQSYSKINSGNYSSLNIVTYNAQSVINNDELNGLTQSPLWGMRKVIELELPELNSKIIDMDDHTDLMNIFNELDLSDESQVAYRNGKRYTARLIRVLPISNNKPEINDKGTYLITGGLGGLGILTAKWLVENGAKHISLLGRKDNTDAVKQHLDELKANGAELKIYKADVTKKDELAKVIKELSIGKFPLKGIVHSVGVLDDGVILNQTKDKFDRVMSPKILGAWYLHELTKNINLDFFIMYSSVASLLGSAGQSNHSSANAFLDALAHYRRNKNLTGLSINWGVWSEIGSAAAKGADKQEKIAGIGVINPLQGIRALDIAASMDTAQVGIIPIDWKKYSETLKNSFVNQLVSVISGEGSEGDRENVKEDFITKLISSPEEIHSELLIIYFQNLISGIMGMEPEDMDPEQPLNTMGLDSLMAIELKNKVNIELGVDLNLVRYMEETNIIQLADELREQLPKIIKKNEAKASSQNGNPGFTDEDKSRDLLGNLENLSEEELDRLLNETK